MFKNTVVVPYNFSRLYMYCKKNISQISATNLSLKMAIMEWFLWTHISNSQSLYVDPNGVHVLPPGWPPIHWHCPNGITFEVYPSCIYRFVMKSCSHYIVPTLVNNVPPFQKSGNFYWIQADASSGVWTAECTLLFSLALTRYI